MEFLDSLDLDKSTRKYDRMRSWYLYEQYKSLERNQLEAAQQLKDKSYQDRVLRQEISDRRARRKIYDQFGLCESKSRKGRRIKSAEAKSSQTVISSDDLFGSYCELHDDYEYTTQVTNMESHDAFSQDGSFLNRSPSEDFKSIEDSKDGTSCAANHSVVEISESSQNLADDEKERVGSNLAQSLNFDLTKQLESVKEDIQCIENLTHLSDSKTTDDDVVCFSNMNTVPVGKSHHEYEILAIWSKLVSFAYQMVQLSHGNCYNDYSYQLMTAVLACDMLWRGISRMCHILQPYVTPIRFANDDCEGSIDIHKYAKTQKNMKKLPLMKSRRSFTSRLRGRNKEKSVKKHHHFGRSYESDYLRSYSKHSFENLKTKYRWESEPVRRVSKSLCDGETSGSSYSSIWPKFSKKLTKRNYCNCWCRNKVRNPSLQMSKYIDSILKDIDDTYV